MTGDIDISGRRDPGDDDLLVVGAADADRPLRLCTEGSQQQQTGQAGADHSARSVAKDVDGALAHTYLPHPYWFSTGTDEMRRSRNWPEVKIAFLCRPVIDSSKKPPTMVSPQPGGVAPSGSSTAKISRISRTTW